MAETRGWPPETLKAPSPTGLKILGGLWIVMLLFAVFAQGGTTWRVYQFQTATAPAFASLGLKIGRSIYRDWSIEGLAGPAQAAVPKGAVITAIDGAPLDRAVSSDDAAPRLDRADGQAVRLTLTWPKRPELGTRTATLTANAADRAATYRINTRTFYIASQGIDLVVALVLMVSAGMLRWKRFEQPVAIVLSFAMLVLATVGCQRLWLWMGLDFLPATLDAIWLALFLAIMPAFPSGTYVPAWSRWMLVLGPLAAVALAWPGMAPETLPWIRGALSALALTCVAIRFQKTPEGAERQRMKWASLAFASGVALYGIGQALTYQAGQVDIGVMKVVLTYGSYGLTRAAFVIIPAGLLVSLLDYRLNDADAAIGRSTGYAAITTLIGVIWAVSTAWINIAIRNVAGEGNTSLSTALSTVVALMVLTPLRTRINTWTDKRFQKALLYLRGLPKKVGRWQHDDDPVAVAGQALNAVVEGVKATSAAIIKGGEDGPLVVLAAHGATTEQIAAQLGDLRPADRREDQFPLRVAMTDHLGVVATLLLGRRSDGASYSKDEKAAISQITEPLADALRAAARRAERYAAIDERFAAVEAARRRRPKATVLET